MVPSTRLSGRCASGGAGTERASPRVVLLSYIESHEFFRAQSHKVLHELAPLKHRRGSNGTTRFLKCSVYFSVLLGQGQRAERLAGLRPEDTGILLIVLLILVSWPSFSLNCCALPCDSLLLLLQLQPASFYL